MDREFPKVFSSAPDIAGEGPIYPYQIAIPARGPCHSDPPACRAAGCSEDTKLELEFRRIAAGRNPVGQMSNLDIRFMNKKHNSTGRQLADKVAHPVGRHVINPAQANRAYDVIEPKLRRGPKGSLLGYGLRKAKGPESPGPDAERAFPVPFVRHIGRSALLCQVCSYFVHVLPCA